MELRIATTEVILSAERTTFSSIPTIKVNFNDFLSLREFQRDSYHNSW